MVTVYCSKCEAPRELVMRGYLAEPCRCGESAFIMQTRAQWRAMSDREREDATARGIWLLARHVGEGKA